MKSLIALLLFPFITFSQQRNDTNRILLGDAYALREVADAVMNAGTQPLKDTLIKDKETAINVAEVILFKTYGKEQIISERPYEIYLILAFWYIKGTLPKDYKGGTFEIIFSAKNGQIIKLDHGK